MRHDPPIRWIQLATSFPRDAGPAAGPTRRPTMEGEAVQGEMLAMAMATLIPDLDGRLRSFGLQWVSIRRAL
jgi:hypothetical protein